jgi:hypothetical protein
MNRDPLDGILFREVFAKQTLEASVSVGRTRFIIVCLGAIKREPGALRVIGGWPHTLVAHGRESP